MRLGKKSNSPKLAEGVVNPDGHVIGLDIGATHVRAAILAPARDGEQSMGVHQLGQAALPDGTVVDGIVQNPGALTRTLVGMWKANDFGCRQVIIGVANPQVVVRSMTMPKLSPDQQAKALPFQAKDVIALPLEEVLLDFQQLGPVEGDADSVSGLLIAAPRQPVLAAVRAVEAAGLRIVRVDLSSFASLRSAASPGMTAEAVVDIGAQMTTIVIHHLGIPRIVRTLSRGGQQLTDRLVERTGAGPAEAEILKREVGIADADSEVSMILTNALRPLVIDIRGSIQYFGTANNTATLERISLTGGGARLAGLAALLSEDVGIPCRVISPLQNVRNLMEAAIGDQEPADAAASAVSVGLAMGAAA